MSDASSSATAVTGGINFGDDSTSKWIIGGAVGLAVVGLIVWLVTRK